MQNDFCGLCSSLMYASRMALINDSRITEHLNCRDRQEGATLLHIAIKEYDEQLFDFLLQQPDVDLDIYDQYHMSPLLLALEYETNDFAMQLVAKGCNVNTKDKDGTSPLMYAAKYADVELVTAILRRGVDDINEQDICLRTALHYACFNMSCEVLDLLLYHGADPRVRNFRNETCFMSIVKTPRPVRDNEVVRAQEYLIDFEDDMNEINTRGISTLLLAVKYESPMLETIIQRGGDVNYFYEDINALRVSLEIQKNTAFDLIWPRFDYNYVYSHMGRPLLCNFFHDLIREDWLYPFNVICNSDVMQHAVDHYVFENMPHLVSEIVKAFLRRGYEECDFFPYICTVLSFGSNLFLGDLETVYIHCGGINDTLNFLLELEIELEETVFISHPYIMLNVAQDPRDVFNNYNFPVDIIQIAEQVQFLPRLFQFCTPTDKFLTQLDLIQDKVIEELDEENDRIDNDFKKRVGMAYKTLQEALNANLSPLPSLLELSRNALRKFICSTSGAKHYCQYRSVLCNFSLPKKIMDVLLFKEPICDVTVNVPQLRIHSYSVQWSYYVYANF